jgi:hypothetical protein
MENIMGLSFDSLLLAFLGVFIHVLMKIQNRKDKTEKFSFVTFFGNSMNWVRIMLTLASVIALLLMADDLSALLGVKLEDGTTAYSFFAFGAGYMNHSLILNVLKLFKKTTSKTEE